MINILKAIIFGIMEGITEWLPISSTGHLILLENLIKLDVPDAFWQMFVVVIQLGAIMAVVVLYFNKLNPFSSKKNEKQKKLTWQLWFKVIVATVPAAVIGLLFNDAIDNVLQNSTVVAMMLILYGILFIIVENRNKHQKPLVTKLTQLTYQDALIIGGFQVLALIPGTSRSGATIIGALIFGVSRYVATEFTFFLSIPVMFGASLLKLVKFGANYTGMEVGILIVGCLTAFIVSILAIKFLLGYVKKNDFKSFGYYRIVLGIIVLIFFAVR